MNDGTIKGQWKQSSDKFRTRWRKLTDNDLQVADGNAEHWAGKLQERYGIVKDEARRQISGLGTEQREN